MKSGFVKKMAALLAAAISLASCTFLDGLINRSESSSTSTHPHKGNYLFDLYRPTQDSNPGVSYAHGDNTLVLDNQDRYECFFLHTDAAVEKNVDVTVTFPIEKGKYKTLCFFAGTAEDHFTHYNFNDSCALSVWDGDNRLYEEMYYALGPSRYVSIDISNAASLTFFVSHRYTHNCLGVAEVSLWADANHSIAPAEEHATGEEDFLDHTYFVYGAGTNGSKDWASLDDGGDGFVVLQQEGKYAMVNNERIEKGIAFTTSEWYDEADCKKFVINALGRYKYLHFNLGHIDTSTLDGSIYVRISVDRTVKLLHLATDDDLPRDITIDLDYGKIVTFEIFPDPSDKTRKDLFSYGSYCIYNMVGSPNQAFPANPDAKKFDGSYKLISQVGKPYRFTNNIKREDAILDGKTAFAGLQMGGILYTEGLVMQSIFNLLTTTVEQLPALASFNLYGAFKYLTFKVGRHDRSAMVCETLNIYCDGELRASYSLASTGSVTAYTVRVDNVKSFTFELVGIADTYRGRYGIVDIAAHTDTIRELNFDHTPNGPKAAADNYTPGQEVHMMRDLRPYDSFSAANEQDVLTDDRRDTAEFYPNDGRSFDTIDGAIHTEGFVLKTASMLSLGGSAAAAFACMAVGFVLLIPLGASTVDCASVALFNLRDKFATLSFKVAPLTDGGKAEQLCLITPEKTIAEVDLSPTEETTVDVNVGGVSEFAFFLRFTDSASVAFGFYDLVLTAK